MFLLLLNIDIVAFLQANLPMAKGMAFASVLDWSLFCGLEICGLFPSYTNNV